LILTSHNLPPLTINSRSS